MTTTDAGSVLVSASQTLATVTLLGTHWSEVTMEAGSSTLMEDTVTELSRSSSSEVALNRDCKLEVIDMFTRISTNNARTSLNRGCKFETYRYLINFFTAYNQ